ncbi:hypothetical protein PCE1_003114 [Barthelona sp. PCE]
MSDVELRLPSEIEESDIESDVETKRLVKKPSRQKSTWRWKILLVLVLFMGVSMYYLLPRFNNVYLPGVDIKFYNPAEKMDVYMTKLEGKGLALPLPYYDLPICSPTHPKVLDQGISDVLMGEKRVSSLFNLDFNISSKCNLLCNGEYNMTKSKISKLIEWIDADMRGNWILDNMNVFTKLGATGNRYLLGYALGYSALLNNNNIVHVLNNHFEIDVFYHVNNGTRGSVVGFEVRPKSIDWESMSLSVDQGQFVSCDPFISDEARVTPFVLHPDQDIQKVYWTYSVNYIESDRSWLNRWDPYIRVQNEQDYWLSIIYSSLLVVSLAALLGYLIYHSLRRDIKQFSTVDLERSFTMQGWKDLSRDIFRPPKYATFLSSVVGAGTQLLCTLLVFLAGAILGMFSPGFRLSAPVTFTVLYLPLAILGGYVGARVHKSFGKKDWLRSTMLNALFIPVLFFVIILFFYVALKTTKTAIQIDISLIIMVLLLFICVHMPLCFIGALFGYRSKTKDIKRTVSKIPREIPEQTKFMEKNETLLCLGGFFPYSVIFMEIVLLLKSSAEFHILYAWGFISLTTILVLILSIEVSVAITYAQLTKMDYRWHWLSFLSPAFSGIYIFIHSLFIVIYSLSNVNLVAKIIFIGWMIVFSVIFSLIVGVVGFFSSTKFIKILFKNVKME